MKKKKYMITSMILERLWKNHVSDLEYIKKWMVLPLTDALSMLMEADALIARMGNRIEYIKTTEVAFFFVGRLKEMQMQCKCLKSFIDETTNSLYYKEEENRGHHFYSRDNPFKRPETLFDGIIPDDFDSDITYYNPMSLKDYKLIIYQITNSIRDLYFSLERLTSYVLEAKEGIEKLSSKYNMKFEIEYLKPTNLYAKKRQELLDMMPQCVKNDGRESCLQWLKQNELLRCYIEKCQDFENENNDPTLNTDVKLLKRRNAIFLKIISSGPEDWVYFLSYLSLYEDIANGLCLEKENGFRIVDEIENSLHPKLQKDIYESFVRMHPDEFQSYQKHDHFPHIIKTEQGLDLYNFLVSKSFISAETDESSFLYLMGCTTEQPKELKLITWLCNKQLLREMLELLYKTLIENKNLLKAKLEELTSHCFVGKKGNPYKLAKRKVRLSKESDDIKNKIATLLRPSNSIA